MKRKIFSVMLALVLVFSLAVPVHAAAAKDARSSVVVVSTLLETNAGSLNFGHGTGFFVNSQYLLTNYHVIEDFEEYGGGDLITMNEDGEKISGRAKIRVYFDSQDYEDAYVVGVDSVRDVAILRLNAPTNKRQPLALRAPTEKMVGAMVYAVGFPGIADNIHADAESSWGTKDSTVTSGTISRLVTQAGTGWRTIQIDCDIRHGNSGGPVVDEKGAAIGIATFAVNKSNESINYAVNIEDAMLLMDRHQVSYTTAGGMGSLIWAAAAVVVLAVVVIFLVLRKKKKAQPEAAPVEAVPVSPAAPAAAPKVPVIRSCAQVNYGAHCAVQGQPILVGRSGSCALRFPDNTPGVSGSHCTVQWDAANSCFVVMDLNSSYGTYLSTGERMSPNVPYRLRAGERFYLAEQSNTIVLEWE